MDLRPSVRDAQDVPVPAQRGDRRRADRRSGDRRRGQAATLQHRRATDVRMDGAQAAALLARRTLQAAIAARPEPRPEAGRPEGAERAERGQAVEPAPQVRCPECGTSCDRLWLVRHVVEAHPGWS